MKKAIIVIVVILVIALLVGGVAALSNGFQDWSFGSDKAGAVEYSEKSVLYMDYNQPSSCNIHSSAENFQIQVDGYPVLIRINGATYRYEYTEEFAEHMGIDKTRAHADLNHSSSIGITDYFLPLFASTQYAKVLEYSQSDVGKKKGEFVKIVNVTYDSKDYEFRVAVVMLNLPAEYPITNS